MATIRIKKSELADPAAAKKFLQIVGANRYRDTLEQISFQYFGGGKLDRMAADLDKVSDEHYEAYKEKLHLEQAKLRPIAEDVEIEFEVLPSDMEFHKTQLFLDVFGEERFFQAQGLAGLEFAHEKSLELVNPYKQRKEQARLAEVARQAAAAAKKIEDEKRILKEAGIEIDE
jgi:hypothetical protein